MAKPKVFKTPELTEKQKRFVMFYMKLGNAYRAATKAGYSKSTAMFQSGLMLKKERIRNLIAAHQVDREQHAHETYAQLIELANMAIKLATETMRKIKVGVITKAMAIDCAGKQLERVAKAEGLFIERHRIEGNVKLNLADMVQRFEGHQQRLVETTAKVIEKDDHGNGKQADPGVEVAPGP